MRASGEAGAAPAGSINTNTEWADLSPDYGGSSRPTLGQSQRRDFLDGLPEF